MFKTVAGKSLVLDEMNSRSPSELLLLLLRARVCVCMWRVCVRAYVLLTIFLACSCVGSHSSEKAVCEYSPEWELIKAFSTDPLHGTHVEHTLEIQHATGHSILGSLPCLGAVCPGPGLEAGQVWLTFSFLFPPRLRVSPRYIP